MSDNLAPLVIYRRFRKDGWPMCPACGEDGLVALVPLNLDFSRGWDEAVASGVCKQNEDGSLEIKGADTATCTANVDHCQLCGWKPGDPYLPSVSG